jgi:hypothetical protein
VKHTAAFLFIAILGFSGMMGSHAAPAQAAAQGCGQCGCQAGHCGAGIAGHLSCSRVTPEDRQRVQQRVDRLNRAVSDAVKPEIKNCNQLVQKIAGSMGYRGFDGLKADQMLEHLVGSEEKVKRAASEGWTFLSPDSTRENPKAMTIDEAMQYANAGRLVVAMVHSQMRNQVKPADDNNRNAYTHGHAFVILAGGKPGEGWRGAPVANAGSGSDPSAKKTRASMVVREWERPIITFWALSN